MLQQTYFSIIRSLNIRQVFIAAALLNVASIATAQQSTVLGPTPETAAPVRVSQSTAPLVLLTMARDHSLFFGAYNDMTDLDGSGTINFNFKPTFEYIGLFNSAYCYSYTGKKDSTNKALDSYFTPVASANSLDILQLYPGGCPQRSQWSGNWLNYVTTSRIDAMRVALYGGYRVIDRDGNQGRPNTLLRRAYIPQDGHTWAKEYTSIAVNLYDITQYTPFSLPTPDKNNVPRRHFFGNLTSTVIRDVDLTSGASNPYGIRTISYPGGRQITGLDPIVAGHPPQWVMNAPDVGISCVTLNDCSEYPPVMRVVLNAGSRVWRWAASQQPVLDYHPYPIGWNPRDFRYPNKGNYEGYGNLYDSLSTYVDPQPDYPVDYTVQVEVCFDVYTRGCKSYGANNNLKPVGVLHDYGENGSMKFGLLTGSYDKNLSGGRLRKNIGPFTDEIVANTGQFAYKVPVAGNNDPVPFSLIKQIDNIRIRNFNNPTAGGVLPDYGAGLWQKNFSYKNGLNAGIGDGPEGRFADWGNPMAEMMFEGLRYFAGLSPTTAFLGDTTEDTQVGLKQPAWVNPYADKTKWCAKPSVLVVSSPYISSDSDQLPGAQWDTGSGATLTDPQGNSLNVSTMTNLVGRGEQLENVSKFIGEVFPNTTDYSPTIKTISSLGNARGLAPNNPENQGSYYAAGVAYFGKTRSLQTVNQKGIAPTDTYVVMLPSPDATIQIPMRNGKTVTIQPFAKTIDMTDLNNIKSAKGQYQTTNQIVGMYVTEARTTPGDYSLKVYVNFESQSAGGDFDMDSVAYYEISADFDKVSITVSDNSNDARGVYIGQNMGYIINGTDHDGAYLVVQDRYIDPVLDNSKKNVSYFLNVPPPEFATTFWAGYCDPANAVNHSDETRCKVLPNKNSGVGSSRIVFNVAADGSPSPTMQHPLWYAARWGGYNGTVPPSAPLPEGQDPDHFIQVTSPASLKTAFYRMFQNVLDTSATQGSVTSNSQQLQASSRLYTSSFNPVTFYGELTATPFAVTQASPSDIVTYGDEILASTAMPAPVDRKIYFRNSTLSPRSSALISFNYANLTNSAFGYPGSLASQEVVEYLRGDRSKEVQYNGKFRNRQTVLGTTVNSTPLYSPDTKMVYLGANDGMLHAFDAQTLQERFAFIPTSVLTKRVSAASPLSVLGLLANQNATHRFYVDGNLAITDKNTPDPDDLMAANYNYLVGFLGRGGKGLFGLPVKSYDDNSGGIKTNGGVWEIDETGDSDMGYLLGKPIMERLSDGTNVVIFGNGYNSTNQQAVLYVVRARDGVLLAKYITCTGNVLDPNCINGVSGKPNGLATPGIMRRDGFVEFAYAGDYLGNVWQFDLRALDGMVDKKYYFDQPTPVVRMRKVFTATSATGLAQHIVAPITSSYSYDSNDPYTRNKQYLWFGTGSDLTAADLANTTTTQTMYGLMMDGTALSRDVNLVKREVLSASNGTFTGYKTADGALPVRAFSSPLGGTEMQNKKGWYMDWSTPKGAGNAPVEQVFTAAVVRSATTPALIVSSSISTSDSCVSTGAGYLNAMDAYSGGSLPTSYFDINRNGLRDETFVPPGGVTPLQVGSIDFGIGAIGDVGFTGANAIAQGAGANTGKARDNLADVGILPSPIVSRRTSWREITN